MTVYPFQIYNASAGSGKTRTLTKEYLKISLSAPKAYGKILALTFTNKAVGEMKHRILDSLYQFGQTTKKENADSMFLEMMDDLQMDLGTLQKKSKETLKDILHNYAFFDVSTIDKFNHRLIRTFAKDLKLPQHFEVVLDKDLLLNEAVSRLLLKAGTDPIMTKVLIDFALEKIEDDKSWDIALDLINIGNLLFQENHAQHLEKCNDKDIEDFLGLKHALKKNMALLEGKIVAEAKQILQLIHNNGLQYSDFSGSYFPKFIEKLSLADLKVNFDSKWQVEFGSKPLYNKTCDESIKMTIDGLFFQLIESFQSLKQAFHELAFLKNAYGNIVPLTVMNSLRQEVKKIQAERDQLSISEFNTLISNEIKNQPAPFIYERLGEKYRHYFVDEFQDTSTMQWENLVPLIGNVLESIDDEGKRGSLFLVGDAKQAIYRWRGGRAEQFLDLIANHNNPFSSNPKIEPLPKNYRSHEEIIRFNNDFFQSTSTFLSHTVYSELFLEGNKQAINAKKGGLVELTFIDGDGETKKSESFGKTVIETIDRVMALGYDYGDICILVRRNADGLLLADTLTQQTIPVVSTESLLLQSSDKVLFLVDLLQYANQTDDRAASYRILTYLSADQPHRHRFIHENLDQLEYLFSNSYGFELTALNQRSVFDGLELAIKQFALAEETDAYIIYFMDAVLALENKEGSNIQLFLDYWERQKGKLGISAPEGLDAVQIMTVHKAKGLEFPIVIFPFANEHIYRRRDKKMWVPVNKENYLGFEELLLNEKKEVVQYGASAAERYLEEEQKMELDAFNLLYVALTRAEKALFIVTDKQLDQKGQHNIDYYSGLFIHYLLQKGLWDAGKNVYAFGFLEEAESKTLPMQQSIPYAYSNKTMPAFTIVTTSGNLWDTDRGNALFKGNLIHYAMGMIHTAADVGLALREVCRLGDLPLDEMDTIRKAIGQIVGHEKLKPYFKDGNLVKNEQEIITKNGTFLRPDRIVINGQRATVIDYKTGKKNPNYVGQLDRYGNALEEMGYLVENKILVYINEDIILETL